jgi:hypothetical protein
LFTIENLLLFKRNVTRVKKRLFSYSSRARAYT